ncbi:hypothetical protein C8R44DRAFT_852778 [Mycena epipterygia]|nr:hypothetical protein C8R44DRAFT_852778 [Mycena epipterygia]
MPQGNCRHIAPEQKRLITTMANYMSPREIATATHMCKRTVYRTIATWRSTGKHTKIPLELHHENREKLTFPYMDHNPVQSVIIGIIGHNLGDVSSDIIRLVRVYKGLNLKNLEVKKGDKGLESLQALTSLACAALGVTRRAGEPHALKEDGPLFTLTIITLEEEDQSGSLIFCDVYDMFQNVAHGWPRRWCLGNLLPSLDQWPNVYQLGATLYTLTIAHVPAFGDVGRPRIITPFDISVCFLDNITVRTMIEIVGVHVGRVRGGATEDSFIYTATLHRQRKRVRHEA